MVRLRRRFHPVFFFIFFQLLAVSLFAQDNLKVEFHFTSISDTTEMRGLSADFPWPVISLITVRDENGRYIHGLADTTRWLGPQELNESGHLVDSVWSEIREYHEEDPSVPSNPNVKDMTPDYLVTEVLDVAGYGLSVMLTMDYSGSMGDAILVAEDASRTFVRQMSPNDEAAIIKFTGKVRLVQEFTGDTTKLMEAIARQPDDREYTALYDALYSGVFETLDRQGRRVVVAYTDGKDNYSSHGIDDVILLAKSNEIPIYLIGLGPEVEPDKLQRISAETGGVFWAAPTADDLASIYLEILKLIRGYYALAHSSTDPWENGTWRLVDLIIRDEGKAGYGEGRYFVPFTPPNMVIEKRVSADSSRTVGADTLHYAITGDTVLYEIRLTNAGRGAAPDVRVSDFPADSLDILEYLDTPQGISQDSAVWRFDRIESSETLSLRYRARLKSVMPMGETPLSSRARVVCGIDSLTDDNEASVILYGLGLPDFTIRAISPDFVASPGFEYPLSARIFNQGNAHAVQPFTVGFYAPGSSEPFTTDTIPSLMIGDSVQTDATHVFPSPGNVTIRVVADDGQAIDEVLENNNTDSCQVQAAIDSLWVQFSDFTYSETIRDAPGQFYQTILARVNVGDQNFFPVHGLANDTRWLGLDETAQTGQTVSKHWIWLDEHRENVMTVPTDIRPGMRVTEFTDSSISLLLAVDFSASAEGSATSLQTAWDDILFTFSGDDVGAVYDLNTNGGAIQDWTSDSNLLAQAVRRTYNAGQRPLYDALDRAVTAAASRTGRQGIVAVTSGLDAGSSQSITSLADHALEAGVPIFLVELAGRHDSLRDLAFRTGGLYFPVSGSTSLETAFDRIHRQLRNYYVLSFASPDTIQDRSWRELFLDLFAFDRADSDTGVYRAPQGPADLRITKTATGRTRTFFNGDSLWQVQPGDSVHYWLHVWNAGHQDVQNFQIRDALPGNLVLSQASPDPLRSTQDTVWWSIPSLPIGETLDIAYTCFVDTLSDNQFTYLINRAEIIASQDTILHNNTASDTVLYAPLSAPDVSVRKSATGDSMTVADGDTLWYVHAGGLIQYTIHIQNSGEQACDQVFFEDILSGFTTLETPPSESYTLSGDTLRWTSGRIDSRGATATYSYSCRVDSLLPPWSLALANSIFAGCDGDANDLDNADSDTVWTVGVGSPDPEIRVTPSLIAPGDTVKVEVMTLVPVEGWDLVVLYEDGSEVATYGDDFIQTTPLEPGVWTTVDPALDDTRMRTPDEKERVGVILQTTDRWGVVRSDTAWFEIQSSDEFYLDENVFRPGTDDPLGLHFRLSSNRWATIKIYDISGGFVKKAVDGPYPAGWNTEPWDGRDESGRPVGSGVYVAILVSGKFQQALKLILVR